MSTKHKISDRAHTAVTVCSSVAVLKMVVVMTLVEVPEVTV